MNVYVFLFTKTLFFFFLFSFFHPSCFFLFFYKLTYIHHVGEDYGPGAKSCSETQMDDWYQLIKFRTREDGVEGVVSIVMDFQYGVEWRKV